jgi:hypothetical protein
MYHSDPSWVERKPTILLSWVTQEKEARQRAKEVSLSVLICCRVNMTLRLMNYMPTQVDQRPTGELMV